jgi:hypothetical protein
MVERQHCADQFQQLRLLDQFDQMDPQPNSRHRAAVLLYSSADAENNGSLNKIDFLTNRPRFSDGATGACPSKD